MQLLGGWKVSRAVCCDTLEELSAYLYTCTCKRMLQMYLSPLFGKIDLEFSCIEDCMANF